MALQLMYHCSRQCRVCLKPSSCSRIKSRLFSSFDERKPLSNRNADVRNMSHDSSFNWPDARLGQLDPTDARFSLPGMVGSSHPLETSTGPAQPQKPSFPDSELLTEELPYERHSSVLEQFITVNHELAKNSETSDDKCSPFESLECSAEQCPFFLLKDFHELFPHISVSGSNITIITLHEKRNSAMLGSDPVDSSLKRIQLVEQFISAATDLCDSLHDAGYWADFIDPTSGRPYLASNTAASLYEKDHQYRELGFEISSFSGCRVIVHHQLGTRPYVGCIFTKAPLDHPLIANLVHSLEKTESF